MRAYAIGRRGRDFLRRTGVQVVGDEINLGDYPELSRILTIARLVMDDYADGTVDQVHLAYTRFVSTVRQEPIMIQLIPVQPPEQAEGAINYEYEPEPADVLNNLLPRYIEVQIYQARAGVEGQRAGRADGGHAQRHGQRQRTDRRPHAEPQQGAPGADHHRDCRDCRGRRGAGVAAVACAEVACDRAAQLQVKPVWAGTAVPVHAMRLSAGVVRSEHGRR